MLIQVCLIIAIFLISENIPRPKNQSQKGGGGEAIAIVGIGGLISAVVALIYKNKQDKEKKAAAKKAAAARAAAAAAAKKKKKEEENKNKQQQQQQQQQQQHHHQIKDLEARQRHHKEALKRKAIREAKEACKAASKTMKWDKPEQCKGKIDCCVCKDSKHIYNKNKKQCEKKCPKGLALDTEGDCKPKCPPGEIKGKDGNCRYRCPLTPDGLQTVHIPEQQVGVSRYSQKCGDDQNSVLNYCCDMPPPTPNTTCKDDLNCSLRGLLDTVDKEDNAGYLYFLGIYDFNFPHKNDYNFPYYLHHTTKKNTWVGDRTDSVLSATWLRNRKPNGFKVYLKTRENGAHTVRVGSGKKAVTKRYPYNLAVSSNSTPQPPGGKKPFNDSDGEYMLEYSTLSDGMERDGNWKGKARWAQWFYTKNGGKSGGFAIRITDDGYIENSLGYILTFTSGDMTQKKKHGKREPATYDEGWYATWYSPDIANNHKDKTLRRQNLPRIFFSKEINTVPLQSVYDTWSCCPKQHSKFKANCRKPKDGDFVCP